MMNFNALLEAAKVAMRRMSACGLGVGMLRTAIADSELEPAGVEDGKLKCTKCGKVGGPMRYVECIQSHREVLRIDGGTLFIEGFYETGEGYDDGDFAHLECHANTDAEYGTCLHTMSIPETLSEEFV